MECAGESETSLVPRWDASLRFDQREALRTVSVPVHVLAFAEDVQAPPQDGEEVASLVPGAKLHRMEGMGHCSRYGNAHIEGIIRQYL